MENSPEKKSLEILNLYREVLRSCRNLLSSEDIRHIRKAFDRAYPQAGHADKALDRADELISILEITLIATKEIGLGKTSVICCLLYKTVQNDPASMETIKKEFGETVATILKGLKEISNINASQKIVNSENFRKLLLSFSEDIRVQLIFLAEKLYFLRKASEIGPEFGKQIAGETEFVYLPLAHKLGLYNIKSEMEDLCLRYTQPKTYADIERKLANTHRERETYIAKFVSPIKASLTDKNIKFKLKYRTKTVASILNKMRTKQVEFEEIYDIFAVRLILESDGKDEKADCWKAYSIVTDIYTPNPRRLRDWISVPKSNGYESLQTTVLGPDNRWVEVQIRSERMDDIAEKGFAAHWKYKGGSSDTIIEKWLNELREILESDSKDAIDLLDDMKINLKDKEIFVFTPKGDLIKLPAGATILDFAYSIHTDIGNKCMGGIVNGKNETIRYALKSGDQVGIITAPNQQPNADWLNFAITTKARNKIRQYINEYINHYAEEGKETLSRKLKNWKIEFSDEIIRKLKTHYKYKFALDLYNAIGAGKHDFKEIKNLLLKEEENPVRPPKEIKVVEPVKEYDDVLLIDKTVDNVEYKFAKCCNPVFGDEIIGFVSIGEGIKIHRRQCKNAEELEKRYPYRIVKTDWTTAGDRLYPANIVITGKEDGNILQEVTGLLTKDGNVKLKAINMKSEDGELRGDIIVMIDNSSHLEQIIKNLRRIPGITKASRKN